MYFTSPQMHSSFPVSLFYPWDQVTPGLDIQSTVARHTHSPALTSGQSRRDNKMWALKISRYILITFLLDGRLPFPQLHQRGLHKLNLMSLWHIGLSGKKVWSRKKCWHIAPLIISWHDEVERQKPQRTTELQTGLQTTNNMSFFKNVCACASNGLHVWGFCSGCFFVVEETDFSKCHIAVLELHSSKHPWLKTYTTTAIQRSHCLWEDSSVISKKSSTFVSSCSSRTNKQLQQTDTNK